MKSIFHLSAVLVLIFALTSCQENPAEVGKTSDIPAFIPETAEMMNSIQRYHLKLWFAGQNENWDLADFELHELEEVFEMIEKYKPGKDYISLVPMIYPSIENLEKTIKGKDKGLFEENFLQLTNTCNTCHKSTGHPYVVITIPKENPYSNQSFAVEK